MKVSVKLTINLPREHVNPQKPNGNSLELSFLTGESLLRAGEAPRCLSRRRKLVVNESFLVSFQAFCDNHFTDKRLKY